MDSCCMYVSESTRGAGSGELKNRRVFFCCNFFNLINFQSNCFHRREFSAGHDDREERTFYEANCACLSAWRSYLSSFLFSGSAGDLMATTRSINRFEYEDCLVST